MKTCSRCRQDKDESAFHKRAASNDGLACTCKACKYLQDKARTEKARMHRGAHLFRIKKMEAHEYHLPSCRVMALAIIHSAIHYSHKRPEDLEFLENSPMLRFWLEVADIHPDSPIVHKMRSRINEN